MVLGPPGIPGRPPPLSHVLASLSLVVLSAATAVSAVQGQEVIAGHGQPAGALAKVIGLLSSLRDEVRRDGQSEAESYERFACHCKSKTEEAAEQIRAVHRTISTLSASIDSKAADQVEARASMQDSAKSREQLTRALAVKRAQCAEAEGAQKARDLEMGQALSALDDAKRHVEATQLSEAAAAARVAGLLAIRRNAALQNAIKTLDEGPQWHSPHAFLQKGSRAFTDPNARLRTDSLVQLLDRLKAELQTRRTQALASWAQVQGNCNATVGNVTRRLASLQTRSEDAQSALSVASEELSANRADLLQGQTSLQDSEHSLRGLTRLCEKRAKDWDQRSAMRQDELVAIERALEILENNVTASDQANSTSSPASVGSESDLLMQVQQHEQFPPAPLDDREGQVPVLVQVEEATATGAGGVLSAQAMQGEAVKVLLHEGKRLNSTMLAFLSTQVASAPFAKVSKLINGVILRLQSEALAETQKKSFCNTELAKAEKDRGYRWERILQMNSQLRVLEAKIGTLRVEVVRLSDELKLKRASLVNATQDREDEKRVNLKSVTVARDGLQALEKAITILKLFYRRAARVASLTEVSPSSDSDVDTNFRGAYKGKQDASEGVLALLDVLRADFERTARSTQAAEEAARSAFEDFKQAAEAEISGKDMQVQLDTEELQETNATVVAKSEEMKDSMDLLDQTNKQILTMKPMCIDSGMTYQERVAKRQYEMDALKQVLCIFGDTASC